MMGYMIRRRFRRHDAWESRGEGRNETVESASVGKSRRQRALEAEGSARAGAEAARQD